MFFDINTRKKQLLARKAILLAHDPVGNRSIVAKIDRQLRALSR